MRVTSPRAFAGSHCRPDPAAELLEQGVADLEQVADHEEVGELGDGRRPGRG